MKRWLVIPLVLLLLRRADSQNMVVGNALPCGDENLSCVSVPTICLTVGQLCNSNFTDCPGTGSAIDEGGTLFASLDCTAMLLRCTNNEMATLDELCDGINQCTSGQDEVGIICENKCRLPYYGDCDFTRECVTTPFGQNCGDCLPGLTENATDVGGPCIPELLCLSPPGINNGMVMSTGNSVGDTATYTCNSGFELIGDDTTTCTEVNSTFAEFQPTPPPFCQPLCEDPLEIDHGMLTFTGNSVGDTATYSCDSGFELIGNVNTTCTQVNESSAAFQLAPVCRPLCSDPDGIDHGNVTFTGNSVGDTATYTCNSSFELIGNASTTCTQLDMYTAMFSQEPFCRPLCDDPAEIENGTVTFTGNSIDDTASYSCDFGFDLIGDASVTCIQVDMYTAMFLPAPPSCILPDEDCDSDPCDPNAECTELPGAGNFICTCIPPFEGDGVTCICPPSAGDDPHFSIMLPTGQLLCYTVQGEHNFAFNLISNEKVQMNAMFLPDSRRSEVTWMGSIGITAMNSGYKKSNATSLRFVAKENKVYIGDKVVLRARNIEKLTFTNGKLTISEAPPVEGFKYPEVLVDLHDVSLSFSIKFMNEHLDIFWRSTGVQTVDSHGLVGQFFRKGIEIDEVRKFLIMPNKEPVPVMRRPVWSFMEREMKKDDQLCWTAMNPGYQGEGLIDGTYFDYLVNDVLSTEYKFKKRQ